MFGPNGDRLIDRLQRAGDIAGGAAEDGDIGEHLAVARAQRHRPIEHRAGAGIAQCGQRAGADAGAIGGVGAGRLADLVQRAARVALQQPGMSEQVPGLLDAGARLTGADDLRLRRDAVAEREIDPRLQQPRRDIRRIGLQRVHQLDPRGAHVARLERGPAALERARRNRRRRRARRARRRRKAQQHGLTAAAHIASSDRRASAG